jgi:aminoglycoside phosphotransferase family enzyme/predicted kinase
MELARLIAVLGGPTAYPYPVDKVEVRHTHISVVFLAGSFAYKIKKPVNLGFLDFSTLDRRRHFCEEEVRLNRRLAPEVYLGVVPVSRADSPGSQPGLKMEGRGEAVEWAVKMKRLPEAATLEKRLQGEQVGVGLLKALARKVASFHAGAEAGQHISAFGRFEVVARNARENFEQAAFQLGTTVSRGVFERLRTLTEEALARLSALIEGRAQRGAPRDTHGDLHLDHVYLFPDRTPPADLVIVDCIEFNERFRFADPVSDMAFLVMDLCFHGRRDLAGAFAEEYFRASGDQEGRVLLPFYAAYRAAVRGKVEGFELSEKEIPEAERSAALARSRPHWLLALGELETPGRRPCLVLVGGLPGTGKSTLAQGIGDRADFRLIRSDLVRKELAGFQIEESACSPFEEGIYTPAWSQRTYAECLRRAEKLLFEGERVVVDASFGEEKNRLAFVDVAARLGLPVVFMRCHANAEAIWRRLEGRRGDASDADWSVYQKAAARWEEIGPATRRVLCEIAASGSKDEALSRALEWLDESALFRL